MHHWVRKRVWIYLYLLLEYLMLKLYKKLFCRSLLHTVLSWKELYEVQLMTELNDRFSRVGKVDVMEIGSTLG